MGARRPILKGRVIFAGHGRRDGQRWPDRHQVAVRTSRAPAKSKWAMGGQRAVLQEPADFLRPWDEIHQPFEMFWSTKINWEFII